MKILYVSPTYYPRIGGVEYMVKSVAERLAKTGHEVVVLAGEPSIDRLLEEEVNEVRVLRWPTWASMGAYHFPRHRGMLESTLRELLRGVDIVHLHNVHAVLPVWAGMRLRKLGFTGRVVVTPHFHGSGHTFFRRILWTPWRLYLGRLFDSVDIVHAVSEYEAGLLRENFGVEAVVVEHGVDEDVFKYDWNPGDYAMYSGRLEKYKNIERVAKVVKALGEMGFKLRLEIYGEGPYRRRLEEELKRIGVEYRLEGFQPRNIYLEKLSKARFLASLSGKEAFGQTVNEANAIGVPAVVAKPWGEHFARRPRTLLVDLAEGDEEIAKKVLKLIEEAPKQARPKVPTWSEVVSTYLRILYGENR